jgi:hypothetical protein
MQALGPNSSDANAVALGSRGGGRVALEEREWDGVLFEALSQGEAAYSAADYEDVGRGHGGWLGSWEEKGGVACMEIAFFDERVLKMGLLWKELVGFKERAGVENTVWLIYES